MIFQSFAKMSRNVYKWAIPGIIFSTLNSRSVHYKILSMAGYELSPLVLEWTNLPT